ncbi:MAG: hypothetical protein B7C55_00965 [Actinomycetales bacterium mxb001]|nr:MAG: hypothetical protein B7C55_00965 [Actinomycetales bacterium mxb001]
MTLPSADLVPERGERGRVTSDLPDLLASTVGAWDALLAAVEGVDLGTVGRKDGRTAARTLVVLGSWTEGRPLARIRDDALAGVLDAEPLDAIEERVVSMHAGDDARTILDALRRARDDIATWASSPDVVDEARLPVGGPLGVVPFGTLVAATAFQCAVAARDLGPAGVTAPDSLTTAGLAALIDTVGAVAAQQRAAVSLAAITPQIRVGTGSLDADWCTRDVADATPSPALIGDAGLLLDIAAGRVSAPAAYARGDMRARDLTGLLALVQVLAAAPGLPGTEGLRQALQAYTATADAARKVGDALGGAWKRWTKS